MNQEDIQYMGMVVLELHAQMGRLIKANQALSEELQRRDAANRILQDKVRELRKKAVNNGV